MQEPPEALSWALNNERRSIRRACPAGRFDERGYLITPGRGRINNASWICHQQSKIDSLSPRAVVATNGFTSCRNLVVATRLARLY